MRSLESSSRIKRGDHSFAPSQLETLLDAAGFGDIDVQTVTQTIAFPSVLDYVRFQLLAAPMTALLKDKTEPDRQSIISSVASKATALAMPAMLAGGRFTFPQEAYVGIARKHALTTSESGPRPKSLASQRFCTIAESLLASSRDVRHANP
jgi:hypothetical protein